MAKYERLQGAMWHAQKDNMKLIDAKVFNNGNVKGFYRDKISGKVFTHWMNDDEKNAYKEACNFKETTNSSAMNME